MNIIEEEEEKKKYKRGIVLDVGGGGWGVGGGANRTNATRNNSFSIKYIKFNGATNSNTLSSLYTCRNPCSVSFKSNDIKST